MYRERIKSTLKTMFPPLRKTDLRLGSSPELDATNFGPRRFSYTELRVATNDFSNGNLLGRGGFGAVYKGAIVVESKNETVAIKRMAKHSKQGEREFLAEVLSVGRVRHRNLAPLLGWCHERDELLLVYEFMANGSLDQHLHGGSSPTLPWSSRFKILQGIASALEYLHDGWEKCILHRDIKPSNVLLDENMTARLGDFGLARLAGHSAGFSTAAAGTLGYMAPEVFLYGEVSKKADIYSFGVVALEVVCARRPPGFHSENDDEENLVEWVWSAYQRGELMAVLDPILRQAPESQQITSVLHLGMLCTLLDSSLRPPTTRLMQALRGDWSICLPASRWDSGGATRPSIRENNEDSEDAKCRRYSYAELMDATENWKLYLGKGSYGDVYRGSMIVDPENENCEVHDVAIMRLAPNSRGEEFHIEMLNMIGRSRHRNLVPLLGWCYEHDELFVVYDFMENGFLDSHLHPTDGNATILPWPSRFKILQEVAAAMDYIHSKCQEEWILHRQIKPSVVMLDKQMIAKLADFGLGLIVGCEMDEVDFSYMAPELISGGNEAATMKSDVYSFGMMALEMVCGRPKTNDVRSEKNMKWVWDMHEKGQLLDVIDATLGGAFFTKKDKEEEGFDLDGLMKQQIIRVLQLGIFCCLPEASLRPHSKNLLPALYSDWSLIRLVCVKASTVYKGYIHDMVVLLDRLKSVKDNVDSLCELCQG